MQYGSSAWKEVWRFLFQDELMRGERCCSSFLLLKRCSSPLCPTSKVSVVCIFRAVTIFLYQCRAIKNEVFPR